MRAETVEPDWPRWLKRWDEQQESFLPSRERRFDAMLDVIDAWLPKRFTALDVGCGPGSLTVRILRRFPGAHVVAVDYDPVAMRVGRGALGSMRNRISWVDANLAARGWTTGLPRRRYDAVLSTTALHWLMPSHLRPLYRDLARLLRRGGVFLNGDIMFWEAKDRNTRRLAERIKAKQFGKSIQGEWAGWNRWWEDIEKEPALSEEFAERKRRFPTPHGESEPPSIDVHERALRGAGFREVVVVWQEMGNRVLLAFR